jgi:hypothetical protein
MGNGAATLANGFKKTGFSHEEILGLWIESRQNGSIAKSTRFQTSDPL